MGKSSVLVFGKKENGWLYTGSSIAFHQNKE